MSQIFGYIDYQGFLKDWIESRAKKGRGIRRDLALHLGIIRGQLTRVLKKDIHLTLDQAGKAISFLELSKLEGHYFFGLVELARAGNNETRHLIKERLREIKKKGATLESLPQAEKYQFSQEDLSTYYENWYYTVIEILTQIPKYQTVTAISEYLNLPKSRVLNVLNFLIEKGIIKKEGLKYIRDLSFKFEKFPTKGYTFIKANTTNWRNRALASLDQKEENNLNLTLVFSLAEKDIPRIKDFLTEKVKELYNSVEDSPREEIQCLCIDFFKVK